jgi:hypothetical protein
MMREEFEARREAALAFLRSGATDKAAEVLFENVLRFLEVSDYAYWLRAALARERQRVRRSRGDRVRGPWGVGRTRRSRRCRHRRTRCHPARRR